MKRPPHDLPFGPASVPPRVLLTTDTLGGVWTFALDLAKEIGLRGGSCALATMGRALTDAQRAAAAAIPGCTVFESDYRLEWMPDPWEDVAASGKWLERIARIWSPDIIHCNTLVHAALPWDVPVVLTVHSCVCSWYAAVKGHPPPEDEWGLYIERVTAALQAAHHVVTPTAALREALNVYPVDTRRITVIPNGRNAEEDCAGRTKQRHLLAAGRLWDEGKNIALLDSIASRLSWPCLLAGESENPQRSAPKSAVFLGRLPPEEMNRRMCEAAVFLHPARYEPFGLAPLEAGLAGCALILSDIPSLHEVWGEGHALFVDPDDPRAWIRSIEWMTARPDRWREFGHRARQRARQFSRERMGSHYLDLYQRALKPAGSPPQIVRTHA